MAKNFDNYNLEVVILLKLHMTKKLFLEVFTVKISSFAIF